MRQLSREEMIAVSGGTETIEVTGTYSPPPDYPIDEPIFIEPDPIIPVGGGGGGGDGSELSEVTPPEVEVEIDPNDPDYEKALEAKERFEEALEEMANALEALSDDVVLDTPYGEMTGQELKNVFENLNWTITSESYETGTGANYGTVNEINVDSLIGYMNYEGGDGDLFLIGHELFHASAAGQQYLAEQYSYWQIYGSGEWGDSVYFENNEHFANQFGNDLVESIGGTPVQNPNFEG